MLNIFVAVISYQSATSKEKEKEKEKSPAFALGRLISMPCIP